nr:MAG TPA: hypothetical protein [Microviridae sp.]
MLGVRTVSKFDKIVLRIIGVEVVLLLLLKLYWSVLFGF